MYVEMGFQLNLYRQRNPSVLVLLLVVVVVFMLVSFCCCCLHRHCCCVANAADATVDTKRTAGIAVTIAPAVAAVITNVVLVGKSVRNLVEFRDY
jgi:hypothetical protein